MGSGYKILLDSCGASILDADKNSLVWVEMDASGLYTALPATYAPSLNSSNTEFAGALVVTGVCIPSLVGST